MTESLGRCSRILRRYARRLTPAFLVAVVLACGDGSVDRGESASSSSSAAAVGRAIFQDVTTAWNVDFVHENGMSGDLFFSEVVGAGAALFDYDRDGDLDLYLVQGTALASGPGAPEAEAELRDRLLRNDLELQADGTSSPHFVDVTAESGLEARGYGMGVATGDYDNDGWVDLYVTNFGANQLWRNNGDGSFSNATAAAGASESRWSVSAVFVDVDRDGWLDLFVGNYVDFSIANHKQCYSDTGARDYCGPLSYRGETDRLFRNRGDGTFEDRSSDLRLTGEPAGALGVVSADFNADGWPDLYVANDQAPNHLWMNQSGRGFVDEAALGGAGVNAAGRPEASMGVEAADFDQDGDEDLFLAHLRRESNTLYVNDGRGFFKDESTAAGLALPSLPFTGFGAVGLDFDGDGWLDVAVANGAVRVLEELAAAGDPYPLHQTNQLFANEGGRFTEVTGEAGEAFLVSQVSRGLALGDIDNDGDPDLVVTNNGGAAQVLSGSHEPRSSFVGLAVRRRSGAPALGAWVSITGADGRTLHRRALAAGSFASARDPRILVGLGSDGNPVDVVVEWPAGERERWLALKLNRYHELVEGLGDGVVGAPSDAAAR